MKSNAFFRQNIESTCTLAFSVDAFALFWNRIGSVVAFIREYVSVTFLLLPANCLLFILIGVSLTDCWEKGITGDYGTVALAGWVALSVGWQVTLWHFQYLVFPIYTAVVVFLLKSRMSISCALSPSQLMLLFNWIILWCALIWLISSYCPDLSAIFASPLYPRGQAQFFSVVVTHAFS